MQHIFKEKKARSRFECPDLEAQITQREKRILKSIWIMCLPLKSRSRLWGGEDWERETGKSYNFLNLFLTYPYP